MALRDMLGGGYLGAGIDDFTGQSEKSKKEGGNRGRLTLDDMTILGANALVEGTWVDLAEYEVEPQTEYKWGYGTSAVSETVGRILGAFDDGAGNAVDVDLRLKTRNGNDENENTEVSNIGADELTDASAAKRDQYAQPETGRKVTTHSKMVVQARLNPGSAGTSIDVPSSMLKTHVTRYS